MTGGRAAACLQCCYKKGEMMPSPIAWVRSKIKNWLFYRTFKMAPIKRLGEIHVKEVQGNLYAVDAPRRAGKLHG